MATNSGFSDDESQLKGPTRTVIEGDPEKFELFKTAISKNCNSCHGNVGSPFPGIANFTQLVSEQDWVNSPWIIPTNPNDSLIYTRLTFAGSSNRNNMPFEAAGIKNTMVAQEAQDIYDYIDSIQVIEVPVSGPSIIVGSVVSQNPLSALSRVKMVLNGTALEEEEIQIALNGSSLDRSELANMVDSWIDSEAGQEKLLSFFELAFQQKIENYQPTWMFGSFNNDERKHHTDAWLENISESFPRTALYLVNNDRPFTEVATTRMRAVTTALLVSYSFADNPPLNFGEGRMDILRRFLGNGQGRSPYTDYLGSNSFRDWRMVEFVKGQNDSSTIPYNSWNQMKSFPEGGKFSLVLPRSGYFNTLAFQMKWPTNQDNQFRVTANQALLVGLNKAIEAGDPTPHGNLSSLDNSHSDPATSCYQCHRILDPIREAFSFSYNFGYKNISKPIQGLRQPAAARTPNFAFWGETAPLNSVEDLGRAIASHPLFAASWTQKLCTYANSGPCDEADPEFLRVSQAFEDSNFSFKALVRELFTSSLIIGDIKGPDGGEAFISVSRGNHFCHALQKRVETYLNDKNLGSSYSNPCTGVAKEALPFDQVTRGATRFSQSPVINAFNLKGVESICSSTASRVISQNRSSGAFNTGNSRESMEDIVTYILGLPNSHPRHASYIQTASDLYAFALNNGFNEKQSMEQVFILACTSPDFLGVGL